MGFSDVVKNIFSDEEGEVGRHCSGPFWDATTDRRNLSCSEILGALGEFNNFVNLGEWRSEKICLGSKRSFMITPPGASEMNVPASVIFTIWMSFPCSNEKGICEYGSTSAPIVKVSRFQHI